MQRISQASFFPLHDLSIAFLRLPWGDLYLFQQSKNYSLMQQLFFEAAAAAAAFDEEEIRLSKRAHI